MKRNGVTLLAYRNFFKMEFHIIIYFSNTNLNLVPVSNNKAVILMSDIKLLYFMQNDRSWKASSFLFGLEKTQIYETSEVHYRSQNT
jgi:hypothetical protein